MPKVSPQHMQTRRRQILEAAGECFIKKGLHRATLRDIAAEAGLSLGALYTHFATSANSS